MQTVFTKTRFDQLELPEQVLEGIKQANYEYCTPVQDQVLPAALKGENIAAQSQTGTGKTATFLITLLSRLLERPAKTGDESEKSRPRALILAPTRELVVQIDLEARLLSRPCGVHFQAVFGGIDYEKQRRALQENRAAVIVATPGRLIDYLKQGVISLKDIEVLVIDEADRMFDMGFIPDIRFLLRRCSPAKERQSMLFSATLSAKVMELAYEHLNISEALNVNPEQISVDKIKQSLYHVGRDEKLALLFGLLARLQPERVLIFTNTKRMAERLEEYLKANDYAAACLTGDIPQKKRMATLDRFKNHKLNILIATDVASRGLHIEAVTHVFNYDLPQDAEDYIHRIGRTARIGATGTAIALAGEEDAFYLEPIEKLNGKIPVIWAEEEDFIRDFRRPRPGQSRRGESDRDGGRRKRGHGKSEAARKTTGRKKSSDQKRSGGKAAEAKKEENRTDGRKPADQSPKKRRPANKRPPRQTPAEKSATKPAARQPDVAPANQPAPEKPATTRKKKKAGMLEKITGFFKRRQQ